MKFSEFTFHHTPIIVCILWLAVTQLLQAASYDFFISPNGDDGNTGHSDQSPFQSFEKVLEVVSTIERPWTGDVVVNVMAGDYFLQSTIELSGIHSGNNGHQLIFKNHGELASAVLIGGQAVDSSKWISHESGVYYQDLPNVDRVGIIYENRRKARKARFPNYEFLPDFPVADGAYFISGEVGMTEPYITVNSQEVSAEQLSNLNDDVQSGTDAYLVAWGYGEADWHKWVYPITRADTESGQIYVSEPNPTFGFSNKTSHNRYYIEGGLRYLDAPGEFYFDRAQKRLFYRPIGPISNEIIYSTMNNIVILNGASHISFQGLKFECSGVLPHTDSSYTWNDPDAAMAVTNSRFIEIKDCHFKSTGQSAINLESSRDNLIENCLMQYLGQSAIKLYKSDNNTIRNCLLHDIGLRRVYCEGVAIHVSKNNLVSHLEIHNSARYGITVRGRVDPETGRDGQPTRDNTIEYVRMYDVNQDSGDTAGLHMAKINTTSGDDFVNDFNQILIVRSIGQPNITDEWKPTGVYLDHREQVMNQSMRNIEVRDYDPRYVGYVASRFKNLYGEEDRTGVKQRQIMQNRPWNNDSSTKFNCSWQEDFDQNFMEYDQIGLTSDFPAQYAIFSINDEAPSTIENTAEIESVKVGGSL